MNIEQLRVVLNKLNKRYYLNKTKPFLMTQCFFYWNHKHNDSCPSFGIKVTESDYSWCKCYTCHKGLLKLSDVLDILNEHENGTYKSLVDYVVKNDSPRVDFLIDSSFKKIDNYFNFSGATKDDDILDEEVLDIFSGKYLEYASERGINKEAYRYWGLMHDTERNRLVFPIRKLNKNLVGVVGRALDIEPNKYYNYFHLKKSDYLYGEHLFKNGYTKRVVIVEGPIDVIRQWSYFSGEETIFLGVLGSSMSKAQANKVINMNVETLLMFDGDLAGRQGVEVSQKFLKKFVPLFEVKINDGEDPGSLGREESVERILNAKFII